MLLQDVWFLEKLAQFDREVIPERRMHAKGSGAYGTFTVTHDMSRYTRAKIFSEVGKKTGIGLEVTSSDVINFSDIFCVSPANLKLVPETRIQAVILLSVSNIDIYENWSIKRY